tara:strand:+ start:10078 stop:10743 length:666 start_codon:yes stop_codon:yes gene_type:complete
MFYDNLDSSWTELIHQELNKEYFKKLLSFLVDEYSSQKIYPQKSLIFNAFKLCTFKKLRVIIIGQDPYHGDNQAHGLSFSVSKNTKIPPSLLNIFKEIKNDIGKDIPNSGNLEYLAKQGVLLLNSVLTVRHGNPGSHKNKGWELFSDSVIKYISLNSKNCVFILWGLYARKKAKLIDTNNHLVLCSSHPSPFSAYSGFFNNNHFSKCNKYLKLHNKQKIIW